MGSKKRGRPKADSFVINIIRVKLLQYKRRYKTTSWNAWTRLTKTKGFKLLVEEFYKHKANKNKTLWQFQIYSKMSNKCGKRNPKDHQRPAKFVLF